VGIDVEPAEPLPPEVLELVTTRREARLASDDGLVGRILFCAKEAAYKAVHVIDGRFLEPGEMEVDLQSGIAETCYGRRASLSIHVDHRIVVLARVSG
jgi:4'-phosphopantetheinyl transferase EntD